MLGDHALEEEPDENEWSAEIEQDGDALDLDDLLGPEHIASLLPLPDAVVFPRAATVLNVQAPASLRALDAALATSRMVVAVKRRTAGDGPTADAVGVEDVERVGCLATVIRLHRREDQAANVMLHGLRRVRILEGASRVDPTSKEHLRARIEPVEEDEPTGPKAEALLRVAREQLQRMKSLVPLLPQAVLELALDVPQVGHLADVTASFLELKPQQAQDLLEQTDGATRMQAVIELMEGELRTLALGREIKEQAEQALGERNTQVMLRQQMEVIKQRLGEGDEAGQDHEELERRLAAIALPDDVRTEVDRELARLARTPIQSGDYGLIRSHLETLADLPWTILTEDRLDVRHAKEVLDEDHHGLDDVKERILEILAVHRFRPEAAAPTLCFVGPPGVGKTSLGRSIARALGRKYERQSMGGVHDEAEIRGHRRTYVGAMPGRIITALRKAGTRNPVLVLDEVDKVGGAARGDPNAALLEVLDPEQNHAFVDNYLGVPFDLSRVMFVCTANVLDGIPGPLRDRMEVVTLPGYTPREKREIARRHILPARIESLGLGGEDIHVDDLALELLIDGYTREAGVRELDRQLGAVLRKTARQIAEAADPIRTIDASTVRKLLGHPRYLEPDLPAFDEPGSALGLAWTPAGGEVLVIEAVSRPGPAGLLLTGQLGDVMKESANAALSFLKAHATRMHAARALTNGAVHLHVPAGAIPKDGPSAGVAMFAALASLYTGRLPAARVAMTGEITLRGRVLPVGGIKEKVLGAHRAGIRTVILPRANVADLDPVPAEVRDDMRFVLIDHAREALPVALQGWGD